MRDESIVETNPTPAVRRVLLVDGDRTVLTGLAPALRRDGYDVVAAISLAAARAAASAGRFDVALIEPGLADGDGLSLVPVLLDGHDLAKIVVTAAGPGAEPTRADASITAYLARPLTAAAVRHAIERALHAAQLERLAGAVAHAARFDPPPPGTSLDALDDHVVRAGHGGLPVLLTGFDDAGTRWMARRIHAASGPGPRPFVALDCSAIADGAPEAVLFGIDTDAGAIARKGVFELAETGTLFLAELDALPPATQAQLADVLAQRVVRRLGGLRHRPIDVRLIGASRHDAPPGLRAELYDQLTIVRAGTPRLAAGTGKMRRLERPPIHAAPLIAPRPLAEVERDHIRAVYDLLGKSQQRTCQALGISLSTLRRRLAEMSLLGSSHDELERTSG